MFWTLPQPANRPSLQVDGASVDPYILPAESHVHSHNPSRKMTGGNSSCQNPAHFSGGLIRRVSTCLWMIWMKIRA